MTGLTISGNDAGIDVVDGGATGTVFTVQSGASVTITGVTIQNGRAGYGGGFQVGASGSLTLNGDVLTGNTSTDPAGGGGAIVGYGGSSIRITNSIISNNTAVGSSGGGGGILAFGSTSITGSTISDNSSAFFGGGIEVDSPATVTSKGNTYSGNAAPDGGSAYLNSGTFTSQDDTFTENSATGAGGGAIYQHSSNSNLILDTLALDHASSGAGNELFADATGLSFQGTIFTDHSLGTECASFIGPNAWNDNEYNIDGDGSCITFLGFPSKTAYADLMPLDNYGGPTETMPPALGSPAIGFYPSTWTGCPGTDQRGQARPSPGQNNCDIGAVESAFPVAQPLHAATLENHTLVAPPGSLFAGATDANNGASGYTSTVSSDPSNGSVTVNPDGSYTYVPDTGYQGPDSFTYTLTDSFGFVGAPATVSVADGFYIATATPLPVGIRGLYTPHVVFAAAGGTAPYKWKKLSKLPKGMKVKGGVLIGLASTKIPAGTYTFTIQVQDKSRPHLVATKQFTIQLH